MTDHKVDRKLSEQSFENLIKTDEQLKALPALADLSKKYRAVASEESLTRTVKALQERKFKVTVANTSAEALKTITDSLVGKSFYSGGSMTLQEIGYADWAMAQKNEKDYKAQFFAAMAKKDFVGGIAAFRKGATADVFIGGAAAVSEEGEIVWGSGSGTRLVVNGPHQTIIVMGTNKIVKTFDDAVKRLYDFQWPAESARVRLAYKFPASELVDIGIQRSVGPFSNIHVILVKGVYGF